MTPTPNRQQLEARPAQQPKPPICPICRHTPCTITVLTIKLGPLHVLMFTCCDCGAILGLVPTALDQPRVVLPSTVQ